MTRADVVPILLYHAVADAPSAPDDPWSVTWARFREDVDRLLDAGLRTVTVADYSELLRAGEPEALRGLALVSFDDGYLDTLAACAHLAERGVRASAYVTTGYLGRPGMLTARDAAELAALPGIEVGSHSHDHLRLDELRGQQLLDQLVTSRDALEQAVQRPVTGVAYPHGSYDRRVRTAALQAGYRSGAGVKNALSHGADDPMAVARWTVLRSTPVDRVAAVLRGEARLGETRPRARTVGFRLVRRLRRELSRTR